MEGIDTDTEQEAEQEQQTFLPPVSNKGQMYQHQKNSGYSGRPGMTGGCPQHADKPACLKKG